MNLSHFRIVAVNLIVSFYGWPSTYYATLCCMDNIILYTVHRILFNHSVFNNLSSFCISSFQDIAIYCTWFIVLFDCFFLFLHLYTQLSWKYVLYFNSISLLIQFSSSSIHFTHAQLLLVFFVHFYLLCIFPLIIPFIIHVTFFYLISLQASSSFPDSSLSQSVKLN